MTPEPQVAETQVSRPEFGTLGRTVVVVVNAFPLKAPDILVHHYDVETNPPSLPPAVNREIFTHLRESLDAFGGVSVVYDGRKNIYAPKKLAWPKDIKTFNIQLPDSGGPSPPAAAPPHAAKGPKSYSSEGGGKSASGKPGFDRERKFTVKINKVAEVNLNALIRYVKRESEHPAGADVLMAINALNVLCTHDISFRHPSKRNKFFPDPKDDRNQMISLAKGIDIWRGYFSSVRMASFGGLVLNFDLTSQPFLRGGNCVEVAKALSGARNEADLASLTGKRRIDLERGLKSVKVELKEMRGRTYIRKKVQAVSREGANRLTFNLETGQKMTVEKYFQQTYNIRLNFPDLPCVRLSKRAFYPMELVSVLPGQKYNRRLEPDQLAKSIKWLTVKPQPRMQMLRAGLVANFRPDPRITPSINSWGVKMQPEPLQVKARELSPPKVMLKEMTKGRPTDSLVQMRDGVWDMRSKQATTPGKVDRWIVVVFNKPNPAFSEQDLFASVDGFVKGMRSTGISIPQQPNAVLWAGRHKSDLAPAPSLDDYLLNNAKRTCKQGPPQLVVCYFDDKSAWQYPEIKRFGDLKYDWATQGMDIGKAKIKDRQRGNPQYYGNVALKVNAKLGGLNQILQKSDMGSVFVRPTMVFGADVTHPSPDSSSPSIAGVVASTNVHGAGWVADFQVQPARQEIISELDQIGETLIKRFHVANKRLPENVLFYRDGVSDGQFPAVLKGEIPLLRKAFFNMDPKWKPKLTYVICGKRHHYRFQPFNQADADRSGNCKPGLVVDTDITHPFDFDWYGQSHQGLLGSSRSSHYTVLVDDAQLSANELQQITYNLCYLYSRATRSVSIVTSAYYAHHLCTRAKLWLSNADDDSSTIVSGDSSEKAAAEQDLLMRFRQRAAEYRGNLMKLKKPVEFWM